MTVQIAALTRLYPYLKAREKSMFITKMFSYGEGLLLAIFWPLSHRTNWKRSRESRFICGTNKSEFDFIIEKSSVFVLVCSRSLWLCYEELDHVSSCVSFELWINTHSGVWIALKKVDWAAHGCISSSSYASLLLSKTPVWIHNSIEAR